MCTHTVHACRTHAYRAYMLHAHMPCTRHMQVHVQVHTPLTPYTCNHAMRTPCACVRCTRARVCVRVRTCAKACSGSTSRGCSISIAIWSMPNRRNVEAATETRLGKGTSHLLQTRPPHQGLHTGKEWDRHARMHAWSSLGAWCTCASGPLRPPAAPPARPRGMAMGCLAACRHHAWAVATLTVATLATRRRDVCSGWQPSPSRTKGREPSQRMRAREPCRWYEGGTGKVTSREHVASTCEVRSESTPASARAERGTAAPHSSLLMPHASRLTPHGGLS